VAFETAQFSLLFFAAPSKLGAVFVLLARDVAAPFNFYTSACSEAQEPLTCTEVLKSMADRLKNCVEFFPPGEFSKNAHPFLDIPVNRFHSFRGFEFNKGEGASGGHERDDCARTNG